MESEAGYLPRAELAKRQHDRLAILLDAVLPANPFYARKFNRAGLKRADIRDVADLKRLPYTTKAELSVDQTANPPYGACLTYPLGRYCRMHQTSGTLGGALRWLDTRESWDWMISSWLEMFRIAKITPRDRLFFAFSFGPFLGFWTAFEAGGRLGCMCLAGGGLSSTARLKMMLDHQATVLFATPTYALRLAQLVRENATQGFAVKAIVLAGEPGGSIPATRARIEEALHARVFDHYGMTEIGPAAIECPENPAGLHILETEYVVEVIDPATEHESPPGELGELVVTNLGRTGSPLIRYRTGDLVRIGAVACPCGRTLIRLDGGVWGRTDDMIPVRGNKLYPAALEGVIRRFAEVAEYRVEIDRRSPMPEVKIEIEPLPMCSMPHAVLADRIAGAIYDELFFRVDVVAVPPGSLPRFEMKSQRIKHKTE